VLLATGTTGTGTSKSTNCALLLCVLWTELKQNCVGCWSGGIVHTTVQNDKLVAKSDSDGRTTPTPLNMRLRVNVPRETPDRGTWNVWNVEEKGDELVIPISRVPFQHGEKDSQLA